MKDVMLSLIISGLLTVSFFGCTRIQSLDEKVVKEYGKYIAKFLMIVEEGLK
jgi:hypothetical protein